jgi:hypothetical protein
VTTSPTSPDTEALRAYLKPLTPGARVSVLEAAVRDARETMAHGQALWLATLGYLIVLEQLGARVARPSTAFPSRNGSEVAFKAGALEFAPNPSDVDLADALYSLRCAWAHEYGLRNRTKRIFMYRQNGPIAVQPTRAWDGTLAGATNLDMQTIVNVRAVGDYVEEIVSSVRAEFETGGVVLAPGADAASLQLLGGFVIT